MDIKKNDGFSLLELLIYMALLAGIMVGIVAIFTSVNGGRARNEVQSEVNANLRFAVEKIQDDLRAATSITTPASGGGAGGTVGAWSKTKALPSLLLMHSIATYNGYIYTTGGSTNGGNQTSAVFYALINSTGSISNWSSTTSLLKALTHMSDVVNNGYIYTTGGTPDQTFATSAVSYAQLNGDGSISNWSSTTALPHIMHSHSAATYNGYIYTTGGTGGGSVLNNIYYAQPNGDGSISNWSSTTPLPSVLNLHAAVVNNGYIYTIGGAAGATGTSTVFYAPINSTGSIGNWTVTTQLPGALYNADHFAIAYNGYIYVMGGETNFLSNPTSTVFYTKPNGDGTINNWSITTALPSPLDYHAAVLNNGYVYTTGGQSASYTSTVFYAPISVGGASGLTLVNTSGMTISYCVVSGVLYRQTGGAACSALSDAITDSTVLVATSTFTRLENTNAILGKTVVSIQIDLAAS
jgi:type II secretory pathway pseudopilin PulG